MSIHHSPMNDKHWAESNLMCKIEKAVYFECSSYLTIIREYRMNHGDVPSEWLNMSTTEWYEHKREWVNGPVTAESEAGMCMFRILFNWGFLEKIDKKFGRKAKKLFGTYQSRVWLDMITTRSVEEFRYTNREFLPYKVYR